MLTEGEGWRLDFPEHFSKRANPPIKHLKPVITGALGTPSNQTAGGRSPDDHCCMKPFGR